MAETTKIQWTRHTANLWWGCLEVHRGCGECYARIFARRVGKGDAWEGVRYIVESIWGKLAKWQRDAARAGEVHEVFVGSMMDIFEKSMAAVDWRGDPLFFTDGPRVTHVTTGDMRRRLFQDVIPSCPNLFFQLLTKRPSNVLDMVPKAWLQPGGWPSNVITGTSVVDQDTADTLIPQLLRVPGRRFLSCEPLLGPVDLRRFLPIYTHSGPPCCIETEGWHRTQKACGIDWVIVGGESGPKARPCDLMWIRDIVAQCQAAEVPVFVKQLGANVVTANDTVSEWFDECSHLDLSPTERFQGAIGRVRGLRDSHGGDIEEFPADLRVREFPRAGQVATP